MRYMNDAFVMSTVDKAGREIMLDACEIGIDLDSFALPPGFVKEGSQVFYAGSVIDREMYLRSLGLT